MLSNFRMPNVIQIIGNKNDIIDELKLNKYIDSKNIFNQDINDNEQLIIIRKPSIYDNNDMTQINKLSNDELVK